jgi:hypothetical protein
MSYVEVPSVTEFIAEAKRRQVTDVVIAWRHEYGQVPDGEAVDYRRLELAWLLAYDRSESIIIKYAASGELADRDRLRRQLIEHGFSVEDRCRNLVAEQRNPS